MLVLFVVGVFGGVDVVVVGGGGVVVSGVGVVVVWWWWCFVIGGVLLLVLVLFCCCRCFSFCVQYVFHCFASCYISVKPEVYISKIDEDFLICNATGFPPPHLTWYKDGEYIKSNMNNETSLIVKKTGGNFTCVASNSAGTSSNSFVPIIPGKTLYFCIYKL